MSTPGLTAWVPRPIRRAGGRARATLVHAEVVGELRRLAGTGRPIIAGPWLGEVGFEILYWIPFLRWAVEAVGLDPARIVAVSRGGSEHWYRGLVSRYVDVFDHFTTDAYREQNRQRHDALGEQKQVRPTGFDNDIVALVRKTEGLIDAEQLHPALMYRLFQPYWWKHASRAWIGRHTSYRMMERPVLPTALSVSPGTYVAVKFYFNDCLPDLPATRMFAARVVERLAEQGPVVSLSTNLRLDDHAGARGVDRHRVLTIESLVKPRNNLEVQSAVVANARRFVGTYGGFSYLAPFYGVPAVGIYADPNGFDRAHLDMALQAFKAIGGPAFAVHSLADIDPEALADSL